MKNSGKYNFLIFILLSISFSTAFAQEECSSVLNISTGDTSSVIFLNDSYAGSGHAALRVKKGEYKILIKDESRKWGSQEITDSVFITECGITKNLEYNFKKTVFLRTNPDNADVYFRDSLLGSTPISLYRSISQVEIKKTNYKPVFLNSAELAKNPVINLEFMGRKSSESFFKTDMFKVLVGTAVALGTTAVYYKLKANDNYDKYNATGDNSLLDKTNKYDLISGIAFGALQVNFGVLIYYFLDR